MIVDRVIHLDEIRDVPAAERPELEPHTWRPASLINLSANPPEPPTIGGLLYPAKRTVLSGETESMKTWLALILAKAELDAGYPVCWVDLDAMGPGALLDRLRLIGVTDEQIHDDFLYIEPSETLDPHKIQELAQTIADRRIRYCAIDAFNPILTLHGLDPNSVTDVETFWRTIADPISYAGAAPVLLDHVVKNPDARGKYAAGSERKASGAIVHIGFRLLEPLRKGGIGRTLLTVHKDRPGYLPRPTIGRLVLDAVAGHITYRIEQDKSHDPEGGFRPTALMQKISYALEHRPDPVSKNWIETEIEGKADYKRKALQLLVDDGYVTEEQGPRRALLYRSIRPYREADDTPTPTSSPLRPDFVPELRSTDASDFVPTDPHRGSGTKSIGDLDEDLVLTSSRTIHQGDEIHEYERPPIDESLIPHDLDEQ